MGMPHQNRLSVAPVPQCANLVHTLMTKKHDEEEKEGDFGINGSERSLTFHDRRWGSAPFKWGMPRVCPMVLPVFVAVFG